MVSYGIKLQALITMLIVVNIANLVEKLLLYEN